MEYLSGRIEDYNNLVHAVYNGPKQDKPWAEFLELLKDQTQSDIAIIAFGSQSQAARINYIAGNARTDHAVPFLELSPFTRLPTGTVASLDDFSVEKAVFLKDFYEICLNPINIKHMIGMNFYRDKDQFAYVRLGRVSEKPNYTKYEKDLFRLLYPHFHTVSEFITETHTLHFQRDLFYQALSRFGIGVVMTDSDLNIKGYNDRALEIARKSGCVKLEGSRLSFTDRAIKKAVCDSRRTGWTESITRQFRCASAGECLAVSIHPQNLDGLEWETRDICFYFSDASSQASLSESGLTCFYGLTKTEARIANLLVQGMAMEDITEAQQITKNTVYTHIKSILHKVGTGQQSSLVSKLTASPAVLC